MLRSIHLLQVLALLFILTACAAQPLDTPSESPLDTAATTQSQAPDSNRATPRAGSVLPRGDFISDEGTLLPDVQAFAQELSVSRQIPLDHIQALLSQARYNKTAVRLMTPPSRSGRIRRAWQSYRKRHVDPIRIQRGVSFWRTHRQALSQASQATGVPEAIIVAIIGIETVYGQFTGDHKVLDTLTTLGFRYPDPNRPERQAMFRGQLADLIELDHRGQLDAETAEGSFAGAMGLPQFMPGSLKRYAADGDGDGQIDLAHSTADAIASVARFLALHGWVPGLPVFAPVLLTADAQRLVQEGLEPETDWPALQALGARPQTGSDAAWERYPLGVIDLRDEIRGSHDVRVVTPNFFALTHYNRSYFYAASVAELAQEISQRSLWTDTDRPDRRQ